MDLLRSNKRGLIVSMIKKFDGFSVNLNSRETIGPTSARKLFWCSTKTIRLNRYLDKYSIAESIEDGTTVKLHYALDPTMRY